MKAHRALGLGKGNRFWQDLQYLLCVSAYDIYCYYSNFLNH